MYRQLRDAFVLASDAERLLLDLAPDLVEIDEALVKVEELAPFSAVAGGCVDQLENERSARHDALAAREEIAPDDADSGGVDLLLLLLFNVRDDVDGGMDGGSLTFRVRWICLQIGCQPTNGNEWVRKT
jgi:hypothetical protein